jgi:hypothetical protein
VLWILKPSTKRKTQIIIAISVAFKFYLWQGKSMRNFSEKEKQLHRFFTESLDL